MSADACHGCADWTHDPAGKIYLDHDHYRMLSVDSAIADDVIAERGYETIPRTAQGEAKLRDRKIPKKWREPKTRRQPGLLIPVFRSTGERMSWRYRPLQPPVDDRGKAQKYGAPARQPSVIDVHPRNRWRVIDPSVELWITEGHKKADSLTSRDVCAVAIDGVFNWRGKLGTLGDWEDIPLKGRPVVVCFDADASTNPNVARAMVRLGRWLNSKGVKRVTYVIVPADVGGTVVKGVDDFFAAGGTPDQLREAGTTREPNPEHKTDTFTDARLAETIADDVMTGQFVWSAGLGWLSWDGARWRECSDVTVTEAVRQYCLTRYHEAIDALRKDPGDATKAAVDGWHGLLSAGRERTVTGLARGIVERRADEFDADPDLLNTPTGVVDLRTGELGPSDPDLLFTKVTGVGFHPEALTGDDWEAGRHDWSKALEAIPADGREWLQIRYGQAITGHMTPDDMLVIQQGSGENGKTTVTTGIAGALGDYYLLVSDRVILANPGDHPTELMDLRGVRFGMIEETPEARRLNTQRLKKTVGTPQITARHVHKDSITFDATHSLFLSTNYTPIVEETDHGTWRRLALVRFPYTFRKTEDECVVGTDRLGDPTLRQRVQQNTYGQQEAALAWLVQGAIKWYAMGQTMPAPPKMVADDTRAWRVDSDLVLAYVEERLVLDHTMHVWSADLLADFNAWLESRGHHKWADKLLTSRFESHDELAGRVERRRVRTRRLDVISRRPTSGYEALPDLPKGQYTAWLGVRFRDAVDEPNQGGVQGVQAVPETFSYA